MWNRVLIAVAVALVLVGCGTVYYRDLKPGSFSGKLFVMWVGEGDTGSGDGKFVFVPAPGSELTFTRPTGAKTASTIKPGLMYTDGGSIPKIAQSFNGLSPWGYAPAYMIHDWIFEARHCLMEKPSDPRFQNLKGIDFDESAKILGEAIQALVKEGQVTKNDVAGDVVTSAVNSFVARNLWNKKGSCARTGISDEHLAEINAVFPTVSPNARSKSFQVLPGAKSVAPERRARIISVIEFR